MCRVEAELFRLLSFCSSVIKSEVASLMIDKSGTSDFYFRCVKNQKIRGT